MFIVRFIGGLGNQMFQYSLLRSLKEKGFDVRADLSEFDAYRLHNGFELSRVFGVAVETAPPRAIARTKRSTSLSGYLRRVGRRIAHAPVTHVREGSFPEEWLADPPREWLNRDIYLDGYWQSERFFPRDKDQLRIDFAFPDLVDPANIRTADHIQAVESVSLHFRGGDYLSSPHLHRKYGSVCGASYYQHALERVAEVSPQATVFVFSNDSPWVRKNLDLGERPVFVEGNPGERSFRDMQLMSRCNHNIIANSSFSWWGAWLNTNPKREVVSPAMWTGEGKSASDVVPSDWIQIQP